MSEPRKYIDTHVHFWDLDHLRYPWLATVPRINRTFLPTDLADAATDLDLAGIVFVQAAAQAEQALDEVAWVTDLARQEPRIVGIVADAPLERGDAVHPQLDALQQFPLVKGVRRLIQSEPLGFAVEEGFVRGVQSLAAYGYSFDICIYHPQMADAIQLVAQCGDVQFVLDHIGKPDIRNGVREPWATRLQELAAFPNVICKLSGMVTEADQSQWTADDLRFYAEQVIEAFGPDRIMFGSDWPVATLASTYRRWFETAVGFISTLSAGEQRKILYDNAVRFYRLDEGMKG